MVVLERVGRMPSTAQRQKAHAARAEAGERAATLSVVQSVARRSRPPRAVPACPAKAQVVGSPVAYCWCALTPRLARRPQASWAWTSGRRAQRHLPKW